MRPLVAHTWFGTGKLWYEAGRPCPEHYPLQFCHGFAYAMGVTPELRCLPMHVPISGCDCSRCQVNGAPAHGNADDNKIEATFNDCYARGRTSSQAVARLCNYIESLRRKPILKRDASAGIVNIKPQP